MDLKQFVEQLDSLASNAEAAFQAADSTESFEAARVEFAGARSGQLKSLQKLMGSLSTEDRPSGGKKLNEAKARIQNALDAATGRLRSGGLAARSSSQLYDPTLPGLSDIWVRLIPLPRQSRI